jgi:hypothetical protein
MKTVFTEQTLHFNSIKTRYLLAGSVYSQRPSTVDSFTIARTIAHEQGSYTSRIY